MRAIAPISTQEFAAAMAPLGPFEPEPLLAIAVSGGPDSMALAGLAATWARARGGRALALLVDHGLRPESAAEVAQATAALRGFGLDAQALRIEAPPPAAGLPAWARRERYRLLVDAAAKAGALHLLLGHHRNDQAETVLLNLDRGSGTKGLAAMRAVRRGARVALLRPVLGQTKVRLLATAEAFGFPVADDPTNRDRTYARARLRGALGGGVGRLAETAARLAREDAALESSVAKLAATAASISPAGVIWLDLAAMASASPAIAERLFARAAQAAGGGETPPRRDRVIAAMAAMAGEAPKPRTLAGARVVAREGRLGFWREAGKRPPQTIGAACIGQGMIWDGRFQVGFEGPSPPDATVGMLGYDGLRTLERAVDAPPWLRVAPRQALRMCPAVWSVDGELLAWPEFSSVSPGHAAVGADRVRSKWRFWARFRPHVALALETAC